MKKLTMTWGWNPPEYEVRGEKLLLFYFTEKRTKIIDSESEEEWVCDVVEYSDEESKDILRMLRENPNSLEFNKWLLKAKIEAYDSSVHVNEFTIGGMSVWLDKATRSGLLLRFQSEKAMSKINTALWYNGMKFEMPIDTAIQMLYALEAYASACYDVTQMHLAFKDSAEDVEILRAYDYVGGYPQKLAF